MAQTAAPGTPTHPLHCLQVFTVFDAATTTGIADSTFTDANGVHSPSLAIDDDPSTWFGSGSTGTRAWLELDLGTKAPYYDTLANITVYNRWARAKSGTEQCQYSTLWPYQEEAAAEPPLLQDRQPPPSPRLPPLPCRQDDCMDMLRCFSMDYISERGEVGVHYRSGPCRTNDGAALLITSSLAHALRTAPLVPACLMSQWHRRRCSSRSLSTAPPGKNSPFTFTSRPHPPPRR
jgi:hypothetical protein